MPLLGALLLVLALVDALWTTLWLNGSAGPLSARFTSWAWRGLRRLAGPNVGALTLAGPIILLTLLGIWVVLLWAGWTLVFAADAQSVLHSSSQTPVDWRGRTYFVGYILFTLGNGELVPHGFGWRIATVLASGSGMLLITLSVTYILSVVSAVVGKRALASQISGMDESPQELVRTAWNGRDLRALDPLLNTLSSQISTLAEQYRAYPILAYYHPVQASKSSAVGIAALDEALTLIRFGVPEEHRPNPVVLRSARSSVQGLLSTLESAYIEPAQEAPPPSDLGKLREHGIPTLTDQQFTRALADLSDRRRRLLGLVRSEARDWPNG